MKTLILPRRHLSFSQISLWERSKNEYRKRYFENLQSFETREMRFGKEFAREREIGVCPGGKIFSRREIKLENEFEKIPLLSFLDSADANLIAIGEDKTGKKPWDEKRVQNHEQLHFYALQAFLETGNLPKTIFLNWFETRNDENGEIELTGKIETFKFAPTKKHTDLISDKILTFAREISADFDRFKNEQPENLNLENIAKFTNLKSKIAEMETEADELKKAIAENLKTNNLEKYENSAGKFFYQTRKTFQFSDKIKNFEKDLKEKKADEQKTAPFSENKILIFSLKK